MADLSEKTIDYRHLLWLYIAHVGQEEGATFIPTSCDELFTDAERAVLELLDGLSEYCAPPCKSGEGAGESAAEFKNRVVRLLHAMYDECTHSDTEAFAYERAEKEVRALIIDTLPDATQTREAELVVSGDVKFLAAIHERTPTGAWIAVQHHPDGDWSVAEHPLPWLPGDGTTERQQANALATAFHLLDTLAGEGIGHTYGHERVSADTTVSQLCAAFGMSCEPGWYQDLAARLAPLTQDYKAAWEALSKPLSWMHDSTRLKAYWGWNLADIANDLIDKAYPGLRSGKIVGTTETTGESAASPVDALIAWARDNQAFPEGNPGGSGRGHIDENARFKLRDMITAIDAERL